MRLAFLFLLAFASPVAATPPQVLSLSETLIAASDTHAITLRYVEDNMGYHHTTLTTQFLAVTDLATGDSHLHLIRQTLDYGPWFRDYDQAARLEVLTSDPAALAHLPDDARPVPPAGLGPSGLASVSETGYALMTNRRSLDIPAEVIRAAIARTAETTQGALPGRDRADSWTLPDAAAAFTLRDCLPQTAHYLDAYLALYLECRAPEEEDRLSFFVFLPDPAP